MLTRKGECNDCGVCCLRSGGLMVENPMIELHEDRCKFYVDKLCDGKYGHCLIFDVGCNFKKAKDRDGNKITDAQIRWFNDNCLDYPTAEDIESGHKLLPECSFSFKVAIDG